MSLMLISKLCASIALMSLCDGRWIDDSANCDGIEVAS